MKARTTESEEPHSNVDGVTGLPQILPTVMKPSGCTACAHQSEEVSDVPIIRVGPASCSSNTVVRSGCVGEISEIEGAYGAKESVKTCQYNENLLKKLPGPHAVADALFAESCAQDVAFDDEDTYHDEEDPYRVEEIVRRASYSGRGLSKLQDRDSSRCVEGGRMTHRIATYDRNIAW